MLGRVIISGLLAAVAQAFVVAPLRWGGLPTGRFVLAPRFLPSGLSAPRLPQTLTIQERADGSDSSFLSNTPQLSLQSDQTITWAGMCIDASGYNSDGVVRLDRCTGNPNQLWDVLPVGQLGNNKIQLQNTNRCMSIDVTDKGALNGAAVKLRQCDDVAADSWTFLPPESHANLLGSWQHVLLTSIVMAALGAGGFGAWLCKLQKKTPLGAVSVPFGMEPISLCLTVPQARASISDQITTNANFEQRAMPAVMVLSVSWEYDDSVDDFHASTYKKMFDDDERTNAYYNAIISRLGQHPPGTMTVLDLGTGPYACLAIAAALAGAKKVYCIEANAAVADEARQRIKRLESERTIRPGTLEVLQGFSTEITLPEKVDLLVSEICGSIASDEGAYGTIRDAQKRFMKRPHDSSSYVPFSYETVGAPASDIAHHIGMNKRPDYELVAPDDPGIQLLADPKLVEVIRFADPELPSSGTIGAASSLTWRIDYARISANEKAFREHLEARAKKAPVDAIAQECALSLSGIALWSRIVFDENRMLVYESRGPKGEHRESCFPTVIPFFAGGPARVEPGDMIRARWEADLQDGDPSTPIKYSMVADLSRRCFIS